MLRILAVFFTCLAVMCVFTGCKPKEEPQNGAPTVEQPKGDTGNNVTAPPPGEPPTMEPTTGEEGATPPDKGTEPGAEGAPGPTTDTGAGG